MASGLRNKESRNYRELLGMKPRAKVVKTGGRVKSTKSVASKKSAPNPVVVSENLQIHVDREDERELLGGDSTEEDLQEQILDEVLMNDDGLDLDTDEILALAAEEEERCAELERQKAMEDEEVLKQEQARNEALKRLMAVRSKRKDLENSLSSSPSTVGPSGRNRTSSPVRRVRVRAEEQQASTSGGFKPGGVQYHIPKPVSRRTVSPVQVGESDDFSDFARELLYSVKQLKEGQSAPFSTLMARAMSGRECDEDQLSPNKRSDSLPNIALNLDNVRGMAKEQNRGLVELGEVQVKTEGPLHDKTEPNVSRIVSPVKSSAKKLKSGITTRPDEAGIKCVVQFAHEKLDPMHVKRRVFPELSFHFLVAGELELLLQDSMDPLERVARLSFLRTLCYHREYLGVDDIRDQYDANLKNIERGSFRWSEFKTLNQQLHNNLTFIANVNARRSDPPESREAREIKKEVPRDIPTGKIFYCADYNRGGCPFDSHHQGVYNKKSVTKWHVCKRCLSQEGHPRRTHPESDAETCPCYTA